MFEGVVAKGVKEKLDLSTIKTESALRYVLGSREIPPIYLSFQEKEKEN